MESREMTFQEEAIIYTQEAEQIFKQFNTNILNLNDIKSIIGRGLRIIRKAEKESSSNNGGGVKMSRFINIGDKVIHIPTGVIGTVIKFYTPTASCEQTMVHTDDGRDYHAPTSEWARIGIDLASGEDCTVELLNPYGKFVCEFAKSHGISIYKAYDHPMVKARYEYFCKTGC